METSTKIINRSKITALTNKWRSENKKIVFSNGCFDILHLGHIDYLEKAKNLADKLVVGLNTDDSVARLKGPERPINHQEARARLLAALEFIDAVVLFDEDTPESLIKEVKPDILVKGNDYKIENIVGGKYVMENGGKVVTLHLVEGFSTTDLIKKIKQIK